MSDGKRKLIGVLLSVFGGLCYGFNMTPVTILHEIYPCAGQFDFAFSHFSGIFFTSTFIMLVYCIWKRNVPYLEPRSVLGALCKFLFPIWSASTDHCFLFLFQLVAGTLWAVAQTAWFIANNALGQPVAFPIITTGPGIIANLWSIFFFKEIRGRNNLLKLVGAFAVTFVGILLIALSKFQL